MPNAEYDTPAELGTLGRELSRVLEGLGVNWDEGRSLASAIAGRASTLDDERVRALADAIAPALRETNLTAAELLVLVERIGRGSRAITVRDLRVAPPQPRSHWRKAGVTALRITAGAGAVVYGAS